MMARHVCLALAALGLLAAGCSSAPKGPVPVPDSRTVSGENREWWDVYSIDVQADRRIRTRVGYLYRKSSADDPKVFYHWVKDLNQADVGFILSDNQAYLIKQSTTPKGKPESVSLGSGDLAAGVRKILQVPGTVELEKVFPAKSAAPAAAQPPAAKPKA